MLYVISMWGAGITQGLLWLALDDFGEVRYGFLDVMVALNPYYLLRLVAGLMFLAGAVLMAANFWLTMRAAGRARDWPREPVAETAA